MDGYVYAENALDGDKFAAIVWKWNPSEGLFSRNSDGKSPQLVDQRHLLVLSSELFRSGRISCLLPNYTNFPCNTTHSTFTDKERSAEFCFSRKPTNCKPSLWKWNCFWACEWCSVLKRFPLLHCWLGYLKPLELGWFWDTSFNALVFIQVDDVFALNEDVCVRKIFFSDRHC